MRGMHEVGSLSDVLRCRPLEQVTLEGPVAESAAFFRLVLFGCDFEHCCLHHSVGRTARKSEWASSNYIDSSGVGGGGSVFRISGVVLFLVPGLEMCHGCLLF